MVIIVGIVIIIIIIIIEKEEMRWVMRDMHQPAKGENMKDHVVSILPLLLIVDALHIIDIMMNVHGMALQPLMLLSRGNTVAISRMDVAHPEKESMIGP